MRELSDYVAGLLSEYPEMKRKIALLQYELERTKAVSSSEFMVAMTFGRGNMEGQRPTSEVSDPTVRIAMNYERTAERLKSESMQEIISELEPLKETVDRLEHYVSLLDKRQRTLIQAVYFDGCVLDEIAEQLGVATRTARTIKKAALEQLVSMYRYIEEINRS